MPKPRLCPRLRHLKVSAPIVSRISQAIFTARLVWSSTGAVRTGAYPPEQGLTQVS
ncbi:MAG: hypothetical protein JO283_02945 [Bradyrhizobium sp.]|jgi:hypothetical protein|nr:hypothetical protein [Bradyrhizobium sp.]